MERSIILNDTQIKHKIKRIAYQIYEENIEESEIILAGINGNGFVFTHKIAEALRKISPLNVLVCEVIIDKKITE